jgi:hypothetical protein
MLIPCRTLIASVLLSILLIPSKRGESRLIPRLFQPLVPLAPLPIAIHSIIARERGISRVEVAKVRLDDLRAAVNQSEHLSVDDVKWIRKREWDGIDWSFIGL